jgi:hypothetical protein
VLARRLVRELGEAPDQLLVEITHLEVRDRAGVQVNLRELANHQVQQVGLIQLGDLGVEVELLEYTSLAPTENPAM